MCFNAFFNFYYAPKFLNYYMLLTHVHGFYQCERLYVYTPWLSFNNFKMRNLNIQSMFDFE